MAPKEFVPVKSADRVFDILEELAKRPEGLSLQEIGQRLGIAGSSIHALVQTMAHRKYVKINEARKITLGNKFYEFIGLFANEPLLAAAKPFMKSIAQQVNENVHLAILDGLDIVFIACEQTTHPIRYHVEVGQTQPAHITGVGKVLLSQFSDKMIKEMYADFPFTKITENTIVSVTKLIDTLKVIRSRGYGLDDNESYMGSKCYAGPLYNANQRMIASLSISIPFVRNEQDRDEEMIGLVRSSCRQISEKLRSM